MSKSDDEPTNEFVELVTANLAVRSGQAAAQQAVLEALIATFMRTSPELVPLMRQNVATLADVHREEISESVLASQVFDSRIQATNELLAALTIH